MSIYEKELNNKDEIFDAVKNLCKNKNLGSKTTIAKMFLAGKKEQEASNLRKQFEERITVKKSCIQDIVILDERSAIVSYLKTEDPEHGCWYQPVILGNYNNVIYNSFDQALIGMVCLKTDNIQADVWISRMLGIDVK